MNLQEIVTQLERMSADYGSFPEGDFLQSSVNKLAAALKREVEDRGVEDGTCSTCGAKLVEYKHGLSRALCRTLAVVATQFGDTKPHQIKDMRLNYNQRCNFQKLKYWNLIKKIGDADGKGGTWAITDNGMRFISGEIEMPKSVWTFRGEPVRYSDETIFITEVSKGWKYRPQYAKEANPIGD